MPRLSAPTFLLSCVFVCGFAGSAVADLSPEQRKQNLASFDQVWNTVRAKHWDPSLGGVNWDAVRSELRPRVERAQSESEAREIISEMLARLHLTHYGVIPGSVYRDVEADSPHPPEAEAENASEEAGTPGIHVRVVDGEALVFRVDPESAAAKDGVQPGWVIEAINDEAVAPVLRRISATYAHSTLGPMILAHAVDGRLNGAPGNPVEIEFRDGGNKKFTRTLERATPRGEPEKFGYMPQSWLTIDQKHAANDVGYIGFNYFLDPLRLTKAFQQAIEGCGDCSGMVIDVRGNPGGIGILATGLAGFFIDRPDLKLGTLQMRDLPMKFVVNPRNPAFRGQLAILIDGLSASTSEIFAGGLQDIHRARVFGTRSAGAALPSMFERLPNGDGFQFAVATYQSESGKTLEGNGVLPDQVEPLTRAALLEGRDPALDAAVQWIHQQSSKGNNSK